MTEHAVVIAGGGPTGLMLAGELALAGVDVAIVERRVSQDLPGSRAGGLHSRTIAPLHWCRRLRIRWESRDDIHEAFLSLAAALICWRRLTCGFC